MIAFVYAEANGVIGKDGTLPWHLPDDMHYFKELTTGHAIVSGRKTFASVGRPLPNRENIILSSRAADEFPAAVQVMHSVDEVLSYQKTTNTDLFVIGGAQVFEAFLPYVTDLFRTKIEATIDGDTVMPTIDYDQFTIESEDDRAKDDKNPYDHQFIHYIKK